MAVLAMSPAAAADPGTLGAAPSATAILARALECAERAHGASVPARYTARHTNRTLELDRRGDISANRLDIYRVRPVEGQAFYELVERGGRPATARDRKEETKRRGRFRESFESEAGLAHETGRAFALTEAVLGRYDFRLAGKHPVHGWELAFAPKAGELAVSRRIDEALNRLAGALWIDAQDFGLTRVEFSLREPFRVWGGLLGSLVVFEGRFEQVRLAPGHWLPKRLRLEMDGWAPFHSLRRRVELDWSEYAPADSP